VGFIELHTRGEECRARGHASGKDGRWGLVSGDGKALAEVGDGNRGVGLADDLTGDDHVGAVGRVAQHLE